MHYFHKKVMLDNNFEEKKWEE
ncbi:hypothetical protein ENT_27920 [Enterococcus faecalis]|nr:hypothetical protein ENT_27920 [Enterococcus faecalis]